MALCPSIHFKGSSSSPFGSNPPIQDTTDSPFKLEEVPVKWMDTPSATEMERGRASEMDRMSKCHKNEHTTKMNKIKYAILVPVL